jgi:signal transduction histidine kinase
MRTMLLELRPTAVAKSPLAELLAQLTEASTSRAAMPFRLFIEQTPTLPAEVHAGFYRIAQEALNNVVKHAQPSQVTVRLSASPLPTDTDGAERVEIRLEVADDGTGFLPQHGQVEHLGLGIMRERAADIQASLTIDSRIGEGTQVFLTWCGKVENDS